MEKNVGKTDKTIRILLALLGASSIMLFEMPLIANILILSLSSIFLITSVVGFCPLYYPFKITTTKKH